jgi:hypothetical protein
MSPRRSVDNLLREELRTAHREATLLRGRVEQLLASNRQLAADLVVSEQNGDQLLRSVVTVRRLLEACDPITGIATLCDVLANIVGTENFVLFGPLSADESRSVIGGVGSGFVSAQRGDFGVLDGAHALVPLTFCGHDVGTIAIYEMLPHLDALSIGDQDVLQLVAGLFPAILGTRPVAGATERP